MSAIKITIIFFTALLGLGLARLIFTVKLPDISRKQIWIYVLIISIFYALINIVVTYEIQGTSDGLWYYESGELLRSSILARPELALDWIFQPVEYVILYPELGSSLGSFFGGLGMRFVITICALMGWLGFGSYYLFQVCWCIGFIWILYLLLKDLNVQVWILSFPSIGFFCSGVSRESLLIIAVAVIVVAYNKYKVSSIRWYGNISVAMSIIFLTRFETAVIVLLAWLLGWGCNKLRNGGLLQSVWLSVTLIFVGLAADELLLESQLRNFLESKRVAFLMLGGGSSLNPLTTWGSDNFIVTGLNVFTSFSTSLQPLLWLETWNLKFVLAATWIWAELFILYVVLRRQVKLLPENLTSIWIITFLILSFVIMGSFVMNSGALLRYRAPHIVLFVFLTKTVSLSYRKSSFTLTDPPPSR